MPTCIYCLEEKDKQDFSLEHVIPQFLGGKSAPDKYKTRDVCRKCNSILGQFSDASFEKSHAVHHALNDLALHLNDQGSKAGVPLRYMGNTQLSPPEMQDDEVCELWLGPAGELVHWIRKADSKLYWYAGGNPITTKKIESRAYFQFSVNSNKNIMRTWNSFSDAFTKRSVRKIMITAVSGADIRTIGFSEPDELDAIRCKYFIQQSEGGISQEISLPININFDIRFMSKLALGISYVFFGEKILRSAYTRELRNGLWWIEGNTPNINGATLYSKERDKELNSLTGLPGAIVLIIQRIDDAIALTLNIDSQHTWPIKCADIKDLDESDLDKIGPGVALIVFKQLRQCIEISLPDFYAHKSGVMPNKKIDEIYSKYWTSTIRQ
jgi:hypothetical protein